ncbi:unnamed protein product [Cochlearia groenlandica]
MLSDMAANRVSRIESWRTIAPEILRPVRNQKEKDDCLINALVRQFEALMKISGYIEATERFDIALFGRELLALGSNIKQLRPYHEGFCEIGLVLEGDTSVSPVRYYLDNFIHGELDNSEDSENKLCSLLVNGPVTLGVGDFPNSYQFPEAGVIYYPLGGDKFNMIGRHVNLVTGANQWFFEVQESYGTKVGNKGFVYYGRKVQNRALLIFFEMKPRPALVRGTPIKVKFNLAGIL